MVKKAQQEFAEEEIEEETATEETGKSPRFRITGAWKNTDKKNNNYLVAPVSPECITATIAELRKYETTGCKLITYENGYRTEDKHPHFIHYLYPFTKKDE